MSGVTITVEGSAEFKERLAAIGEAQRARLKAAIADGAVKVHAEAVRMIQEDPKSGTVYGTVKDVARVAAGTASKSAQKRVHQASAPGEAPASDTGNLVSKLHVRPTADGLSAEVVSSADYSADLEFGTEHIAPRPFMRPALAANRDAINVEITAAMRFDA